jgi:Conserved in the green lineage and diatoms 27
MTKIFSLLLATLVLACLSRTCCSFLVLVQDRAPSRCHYRSDNTYQIARTSTIISPSSPPLSLYLAASKNDGKQDFDNTDTTSTSSSLVPETSFGSESVPEAQRPINEYLDMKTQPLFGWASLDSGIIGLLQRLALTYVITFIVVCFPIAGATYTQEGYLIQKILAANVGCLSFVGLLLLRIYTGWSYVGQRLESKVVEFEETGWYDGNVEVKTLAEQKRDKFLYSENVKPIVQRLQSTSLACLALWVASIVAFQTSASIKPFFEQYDPKVLERLGYDDKLADVAAQNSGGKPIYCDNRYYRAIANGGQGCD